VDAYSTKSIKLFSNGSIQVAGCSNVLDCKRVVTQLKILIEFITEKPVDMPFSSFKVVMINTNFSVNYKLHVFNIARNLAENPMFDVTYEPNNYSGVNVKFSPMPGMKRVTTNIFSTGNIIITGAETLMEVAHAYRIINANLIGGDVRIEPSDVVKTFETTMGAKFTEWLRVMPVKDPVLVKKRMDALYARTSEYEVDEDDVMELMHICSDFNNYEAYDKLCAARPSEYDCVFDEVYKMLK
jgi:TATA-box binding protein (TBP) (component of TFIID and TFIIIB)